MTEVTIGECVRTVFEPDDDGVNFADGADEGMIDMIVDGIGGDEETECCVDAMGPGDGVPCCMEGWRRL